MKNYLVVSFLLLSTITQAQLKTTTLCPAITVDLLDGKVNGLLLNSTVSQIKKTLPCFTSAAEDTSTTKCGGGVFFKDKDLYFYTSRDYVEIGPNFKGKLSVPLMGSTRAGLFKWLGNPKIKDVNWDCFETSYGLLLTYYNKAGKVNKIQFTNQSAETIKLCE